MKTSLAEVQIETSQGNLPLSWVNKLFDRFAMIYGNKFLDMWKDVDHAQLKQAWSEEMAGYTAEEIRRGLNMLRSKPWPPTLPEFMDLCRTPLDYESLFNQAANNHRSSKLIYWASRKFSFYDLQHMTYSQAAKRWKACVDEVRFNELPDIPTVEEKALPAPGKTEINNESGRKRISELAKMVKEKTDHKEWARKILSDKKNFPEIAVKFAITALSLDHADL